MTHPNLLEAERVHSIVGAFYDVNNYYGYGFVESVYAGGMEYELIDRGHTVARELAIDIRYKGRHVTWPRLDMLVDDRVILEIKATELLPPFAPRQLVNYLRATPYKVGLLLHFGPKPKFHRFVDTQKESALIRAVPRHPRSHGSNLTGREISTVDESERPSR